MKFTCTKENLYRGLSVVNHLAGKNTTLPILNNVLLKAENGLLELSTTNLEVGVKCQVRGKIDADGAFTVQARLLTDYVNLLPSDAINLEVKDTELNVACQQFETKIKGVSSEDFPLIASLSAKGSLTLSLSAFKEALGQSLFAVAMDETRPEISGLLFQLSGKSLVLAATDSFRLAERKVDLPQALTEEAKFIVPFRTLQELNRILSEDEGEDALTISWTENQVGFSFSGIELISRLIEGQYPDYQQIIPTNFKTEVVFDAKECVQLVKSAALFCRAGINDIQFKINQATGALEVNAANTQVGENKAGMQADVTGETNEIVFNYRYVLDGLQNMNSEKVRLKLIDRHNPGVFVPEGKNDYTYIIMPIKS